MAKEVEVTKVDEPTNLDAESTVKQAEVQNAPRGHKPWLWAVIAASALLILIILGGAIGMMLHSAARYNGSYARGMNGTFRHMQRGAGMNYNLNNGTLDTSVTRLSGVVTAVDGNTLTVAGNGQTTKVTVGDATIYSGAAKPVAVNDTVRVLGNKNSDGSIAASQLVISRQ